MGRWISILVVLLALSAALNAAVAWTCVLLHKKIEFNGIRLGQLRADGWGGHGADRRDDEPEVWLQHSFTGRGVEVLHLRERPGAKSLRPGLVAGDVQVTVVRAGWPMAALEGRTRLVQSNPASEPRFAFAIATRREVSLEFNPALPRYDGTSPPMRSPVVTNAALPLRPTWPGFAVNGAAYAAAILLLWMTLRTIRAGIRRARHRCAGCGYPVGVSPRCSECGRAVRPRPTAATR